MAKIQRIAAGAWRNVSRLLLVLALPLAMSACARPPVTAAPNDPFEATNRARFEANAALTQAILPARDPEAAPRPPSPALRVLRNVGANLSIPGTVVNDLLQLRPDRAVENTLRFALNSTVGLGGVFDVATPAGLPGRRSDFGETLHRWGMGEGAYVVLPILGPSTERDTLGLAVDLLIRPWDGVVTAQEARAITALRWAGRAADMAANADLLDANVMRSADPYAQARLLYLQTRRYHLGIATEDDAFDPYDFLD